MPPTVAFLWHMHQPDYVDRTAMVTPLPWVRLHGVKAYYDMAVLAEAFPEVRQTVNLTPSLITQLLELAEERVSDHYRDLTLAPAADLPPEQRVFILQHFFMANWDTMIKPIPRYWNLLLKRGLAVDPAQWAAVARRFSTQDYLDLQLWFNLAWFGHAARARYPAIDALREQGERFTEEDKRVVLDTQSAVLRELVPRYRALQDAGTIELSTSPFYHPIIPLLIDSDSALRAQPDARLPQRFAVPEDARAHLARGLALHERVFGRRPSGLWPSEGSVSPEMVPLLHEQGVRWIATDEGILARSLSGTESRTSPYLPYRVTVDGASVDVVFRDRTLSDLIGFTYARNAPEVAAQDFLDRVQAIAARERPHTPLIAVILDGENPWEAYPDGGKEFLSQLYRRLGQRQGVTTATLSDAVREAPAVQPLGGLHSGSWINQNFKIWIGHPEDNQAWTAVRRTRQFLVSRAGESGRSPESLAQAWEALYAAEGSDWFWWYGDDFSSVLALEFDRIFRSHLTRVYQVLGEPVPPWLRQPIKLEHGDTPIREPVGFIFPTIDGVATSFYEWWSASYYSVHSDAAQMYCPVSYLSGIWYGFDLDHLYVRCDPAPAVAGATGSYLGCCHVLAPRPFKITFPLSGGADVRCALVKGDGAGDGGQVQWQTVATQARIGVGKIVELAVPFADLDLKEGERVEFVVEILDGGIELDHYPAKRPCSFVVPGRDFEAKMWSV
jgi:alpha-amylase/alpha-mannosidase (GH57 family)